MAEKFRFAVMGAGNISNKFCEAVLLTEGCQVSAIASKNLEKASRMAQKYGNAKPYDSYEKMLAEEKPDAVYIAVTTNAHYDLAMLCLDYKVPVLCEKAMFQTAAQARTVFRRSRELGVFVMEGMWSLFLPNLKQARQWILDGKIGDITLGKLDIGFQAEKDRKSRYYNPALGGGAGYDILVYGYDILTWLVNQPIQSTKIQALFTEDGVDKTEVVLLKFEDCLGVLTTTFEADMADQEQAVIYGSKGRIVIPHPHFGNTCTLYTEEGKTETFLDEKTSNGFVYEIQEVMECIQREDIESKTIPHAMTLKSSALYDEIMKLK